MEYYSVENRMVMEFEFITGLAYLSNQVSSRVQTQYPEIVIPWPPT